MQERTIVVKYSIGKKMCLLCAAMMLTGCGQQNEQNDFVSIETLAVEEQYQQTMREAELLLTDYYLGLHAGSFSACMAGYPDFYQDAERNWILNAQRESGNPSSDSSSVYDAFTKSNDDYFREQFGDDYKVKLKITQLYNLTEESCTEMEQILKNNFGKEIDLTSCHGIALTETMFGSKKSEDSTLEWYLLCYDGKTYLYDNAFETV